MEYREKTKKQSGKKRNKCIWKYSPKSHPCPFGTWPCARDAVRGKLLYGYYVCTKYLPVGLSKNDSGIWLAMDRTARGDLHDEDLGDRVL